MRDRCVGIVREVYNKWERRVPLGPHHVKKLVSEHNVNVLIQPCTRRVFSDDEFRRAGATVTNDLSPASLILGVKQVPVENVLADKLYMFFSHTKKAQPENMELLDDILRKKVTLIDYECITENGVPGAPRRIAFGRYAGLAGMLEGLRGLGQRLLSLGHASPFLSIAPCYTYASLAEAQAAVDKIAEQISSASCGFGNPLDPMVFVFTGRGKVTQGALEIFQRLPHKMVTPEELPALVADVAASPLDSPKRRMMYGCIAQAQHMVRRTDGSEYSREDYFANPDRYEPIFHETVAPHTSMLINGMYWDQQYPRLLTIDQLAALKKQGDLRLMLDADLTCDAGGSVEILTKTTDIDAPCYVYDLENRRATDNLDADGVMLMGVDILPSELPREASNHFGDILVNFIPALAKYRASDPFSELPPELAGATIAANGSLTPRFEYISKMRAINEAAESKGYVSDTETDAPVATSFLIKGHLFDSGFINQALDLLESTGIRYSVTEIDVVPNASTHRNESSVVIRCHSDAREEIEVGKEKLRQLATLVPAAQASVSEVKPHGRIQSGAKDSPTLSPAPQQALVLGAGLVSGPLIEYLAKASHNVKVVCGTENDRTNILRRFENNSRVSAVMADASRDTDAVEGWIKESAVVISVLPATMHVGIAKLCLKHRTNLVTASYASPQMLELDQAAKDADLTILNEMGLDPGMDHMSAMQLIDRLRDSGRTVTGFSSVCGGLPAPEAANNPLAYKFSWSPRGVLTASKNAARFLEKGEIVEVKGEDLLRNAKPISILPSMSLECLPNRDSMSYKSVYGLDDKINHLFRGTLRYGGFSHLFFGLRTLGLFDDAVNPALAPGAAPMEWKSVMGMLNIGDEAAIVSHLTNAGFSVEETVPVVACVKWLGLLSSEPATHRNTVMDTFCALLEAKLSYAPLERDMALMFHQIWCETPEGVKEQHTSTFLAYGVPGGDTAMASTVGVTAAIGAELLLSNRLTTRGVLLPTIKEVYEPSLELLAKEGFVFEEGMVPE